MSTNVTGNGPPGVMAAGVLVEPRDGDLPGAVRERAIDVFQAAVAEVCGIMHHTHARLVAAVAEALERGWWNQSGIRSPEHWLCWQTGLSPAHAAQVVAVARRRGDLPATMAAFDAGELALDQVVPIVRWAPVWADRQACDLAKRCTVTQLRAALARYPFAEHATSGSAGRDPVEQEAVAHDAPGHDRAGATGGAPPADRSQPAPGHEVVSADLADPVGHRDDPVPTAAGGEFCSLVEQPDGSWRLSARLDADHGLVLDAALAEIRDALFRDAGHAPSGVDALMTMARRSLDAVTDRGRRDRYRVHVTLDEHHQLLDPLGHTLPDWIRDLITCDTTMSVTWQRNGIPIAQGSVADSIPAATRRHVLARDGGCRVPGCGRRNGLDLHHVIHRRHHGTNDPWNLIALCGHHHRMHHRGQLGIAGNAEQPDGITFTSAAGMPITPNRLIRPPAAPPEPPTGPGYRHPIGEPLQLRWLEFRPPPAPPTRPTGAN